MLRVDDRGAAHTVERPGAYTSRHEPGPALPARCRPASTRSSSSTAQQLAGAVRSTRRRHGHRTRSERQRRLHEPRLPERRPLRRRLRRGADRVHGVERAPGDPALANAVVRAINARRRRPDPHAAERRRAQVPRPRRRRPGHPVRAARRLHGRRPRTRSSYASTSTRTATSSRRCTRGQMLSDDPYGDVDPVPYLNRQLYIPSSPSAGSSRRRARSSPRSTAS